MGKKFAQRNHAVGQMRTIDSITLGTVVDTNDPQQMGRLKILCPSLGDDNSNADTEHLPWATYVSPLGGMVNNAGVTRGPNDGASSPGPLAYGFFGIPRIGSTVLVACIDGDPYYRVWLGAVYDQGVVNTLPHGRFFYQKNEHLDGNGTPEGPLNAYEQPIEPLYSNWTKAFGGRNNNYEWRTRGADYSAGSNTSDFVDQSPSNVADENTPTPFTSSDGKTFEVKNGYAKNRLPGYEETTESSVFSWTSPGFHSISMDDRPENCRMRFRTSSGTQVILDDTNERIYISTAEGGNYLELDFDGNIDVYSKTKINLHAESDINFTSDKSVRIFGKEGIHMKSGGDIVMDADGEASLKGTTTYIDSAGNSNIKAAGQVILDGTKVYMHSIPAAAGKKAKWTNRVPQHEPWARTSTAGDYTHDPKYGYDDPNVGTEDKPRGKYWRR